MQNHVLDYLYEIVKKKPDKTAFSDGVDAMTFLEIYRQSGAIGTFLAQMGIYKEPVVVFMNKHPKTITAFYGVVAAGCFYVPLDGEMPGSRIELILQNVRANVMICDKKTCYTAEKIKFTGKILLYDEMCETDIEERTLHKIHDAAIDTDLVYVMFTSGSTGIPKGVTGNHRAVIDYIEQLSDVLGFAENTVFGNQTPLYFDASMKEIYPTLKFGATTYLIPKELFMFPVKLVEFLNKYQINTVCWVVSALEMISAFGTFKVAKPEYLKTIVFAGEIFPVKQFNQWKAVLPETNFFNLYGPTEGTGVCCYYKVEREFGMDEVIPVGRPFRNTDIILLNEKNEWVSDGDEGEICIRGTCLSSGYYNDMEKTNAVFVQNPLNQAYPELIYRTGDIGRYNEKGDLLFVSRKDFQIKHMGHRIELGEIEANVHIIKDIGMAGCIYDKGKNKIVLFYVGDIEQKVIAERMKEMLPRYMVPNCIRRIAKMPFTPNGKIDRKELERMYWKEC